MTVSPQDPSLWNSTVPRLTVCFQETVVMWSPCAFFWLGSIGVFISVSRKSAEAIPWTLLSRTKAVITIILAAVSFSDVVHALTMSGSPMIRVAMTTALAKTITFLMVLAIQVIHLRKGVCTSGILFAFWSLMSMAMISKLHNILSSNGDLVFHELDKAVTITNAPLVLIQLVLSCFSDSLPAKTKDKCPELTASFLSKITFCWFDKLIIKGFRRPLTESDVWQLRSDDQSADVGRKFELNLNRHKMQTLQRAKPSKCYGGLVFCTIITTFWKDLLTAAVIKLISSVLIFGNPIVLSRLIGFMNHGDFGLNNEPQWHGYFYAMLLIVCSAAESLLNGQYDYRIFVVAMRIRAGLMSVIYKKVLTLSPTSRKSFATGEIVNLMSVDTQRVMEYVQIVNLLWICPLQIGISVYLLWLNIEHGSLAGLSVMLLLLPLNFYVGSKMRRQQVKLLDIRDKRIKLMNEVLNGIKVLKLYAWEPSFIDVIKKFRGQEIGNLRYQAYLSAAITFAFNSAPFFVAITSFATFIIISPNNVLDAQKAFVSLTIFNILRRPLAFFPQLITTSMMFLVSVKRINAYLNGDDLEEFNSQMNNKNKDIDKDGALLVTKNASFTWNLDEYKQNHLATVKDVDLRMTSGQLLAVVGRVGSGKSSLLSGLLGEMHLVNGQVKLDPNVAYVPQQAWIQNNTVKGNILFGREFNKNKYNKTIKCCALEPDLAILADGDRTEVGENGLNLSGGQKQRISLARAVYADADVYLLDDPLSAVDSHVGRHIFDQVIGPKGLLKNKTRILVTHNITYLPRVDQIAVVKDGRIVDLGSYSELIHKQGDFAEFLAEFLADGPEEVVEPEDLEVIEEMATQIRPHLERRLSRLSSFRSDSSFRSRFSSRSMVSDDVKSNISKKIEKLDEDKKLIVAEKLETGSVGVRVYRDYIKAIGTLSAILTLVSYLFANCFAVGTNLWLSDWSNDAAIKNCQEKKHNQSYHETSKFVRLGVYAGLGLGQTIFILVATITLNLGCLRGSSILHNQMLDNIIRAPMSFFDTTPVGRILNRFAKDIDITDVTLLQSIRLLVIELFRSLATVVTIGFAANIVVVVFVPLALVYFGIQKLYISTSRQLKRLESASRSPIYSHFGETISGAASIRAYHATQRFVNESHDRVDKNHAAYFAGQVAGRWLAVRLEFLGNIVVFLTALYSVISRGQLTPGQAGLIISMALTITANLNLLVRGSIDLETNIVSVERIAEYTKTEREAEWTKQNEQEKGFRDWPSRGAIGFCHYSARYRLGLGLILKQLTFHIPAGCRVGVVGRTGAGKSSLTLALFRIIEPAEGSLCIDGVSVTQLGLHDLRSKLTIIPQDPVLFTGTLRFNLDPFGKHSDSELWCALELAHLKPFVDSLDAGLDHEITESGDNLSVGQKQLVCLARALLKKSKILVLDEATAAVDLSTDELIQKTIRQEFKDCTIVTIAHRLNTVIDYDRIIVMDSGQIAEYDGPQVLLANENSLFYSMVKDVGEATRRK